MLTGIQDQYDEQLVFSAYTPSLSNAAVNYSVKIVHSLD